MAAVFHYGWHNELTDLVATAERRLVVVAPFISSEGADFVATRVRSSLRTAGRIEVLTDLSPSHVFDGSLQPRALVGLLRIGASAMLWHVPRLHAKVYIADDSRAIVTSGNLTASGLYRNAEYGVRLDDQATVAMVQDHFNDYRETGTPVAIEELLAYARIAEEVQLTCAKQNNTINPRLRRAFEAALKEAEDQLIRLRLAGGAMHTVFQRTIQYLLTKYGPLSTRRIHELVEALHPDLCDNSIDRVIDGKHFGKKWKHAVRTAQQQLKRAAIVEYAEPEWRLTPRNGVE
jgi:hypothetical protein